MGPTPDRHRTGDILEGLLASILEGDNEPVAHVLMDTPRDHDATRGGDRLQPRRDVHAIAEDVVAFDDDVAEIHANAKDDPAFLWNADIARGHGRLHIDHAAHRVDDAGKLQQQAISSGLDDASAIGGNRRVDLLPAQCLQRLQRAALVLAHQPGKSDHVDRHDRGKAPLLSHRGAATEMAVAIGSACQRTNFDIRIHSRTHDPIRVERVAPTCPSSCRLWSVVPVLVLFAFIRRAIVSGLAAGAVKG